MLLLSLPVFVLRFEPFMVDACGMARRNKPSSDQMLLRKIFYRLTTDLWIYVKATVSHLIGLFLKPRFINLINWLGQSPSLQAGAFSDSQEILRIL